MNKFAISVIIAAYNAGSYLAEAIASIFAQTLKPYEINLIDDGSTDGSAWQATKTCPSVRYFRQGNKGTAAARNKGVEVAQGTFFAFLDADDLWVKDKLAVQVTTFMENPELDAVFGYVKQFISPDLDEEKKKRLFCSEEFMPGELPSTMLIKRGAFSRVGLLDTQWRVGKDVSWIL